MIIALATPAVARTLDEGLDKIKWLQSEAASQGAEIVCFPEAYLPGLRGQDFDVVPFDRAQQERALQAVSQSARTYCHRHHSRDGEDHGCRPSDSRLRR